MEQKKLSGYEIMVLVAYGYFVLLGLTFLVMRLYFSHQLSYMALLVIGVFAAQAWYRHKLSNLIIGVITLGVSIFSLLEFLASGFANPVNLFSGTMLSLAVLGIIFSGLLIFSYVKLSFMEV